MSERLHLRARISYYSDMENRRSQPDLLLLGAPKAGTSALHAALAQHPQVFVPAIKEPKYYMCADAPPPAYRGPGDAHSQQEWVWRRSDYERLYDPAPAGSVRLDSTPFHLYLPSARQRIAEHLPDARFVVLLRDPVDRAYSNWMHLWVDGLEAEADFSAACALEPERIAAGWAPFWHYLRMGRYGEQLADLFSLVDRDRVLVMRYRELIDNPAAAVDRVARFAGIDEGRVATIPHDNSRPYVAPGVRTSVLGRAIRLGAVAGAYVPPQVWRQAVKPFYAAMQAGSTAHRPALSATARALLVSQFTDDIALLEELLATSFQDWLSTADRGSFKSRVAAAALP